MAHPSARSTTKLRIEAGGSGELCPQSINRCVDLFNRQAGDGPVLPFGVINHIPPECDLLHRNIITMDVQMENNINITPAALARIEELLKAEADPQLKLRTFVQGGGCSGFQYGFTFDLEQNGDDFTIINGGVTVLVDAMSMTYLAGSTIDYVDDLSGSSFTVKNPNAESTCGCGSSFSI